MSALVGVSSLFGEYKPVNTENFAPFRMLRSYVPLKTSDLLKIKELYMKAGNSESDAAELITKVIEVYQIYFNLPTLKALDAVETKTAYLVSEVVRANEPLIRWLLLAMMQQSVVSFRSLDPLLEIFHNYNVFIEDNTKTIRNLSTELMRLYDTIYSVEISENPDTPSEEEAKADTAADKEKEKEKEKDEREENGGKSKKGKRKGQKIEEETIVADSDHQAPPTPVLSPAEKYAVFTRNLDEFFANNKSTLTAKQKAVCDNVPLLANQRGYIYELIQSLLKTSSFGNCDVDYMKVFSKPFL